MDDRHNQAKAAAFAADVKFGKMVADFHRTSLEHQRIKTQAAKPANPFLPGSSPSWASTGGGTVDFDVSLEMLVKYLLRGALALAVLILLYVTITAFNRIAADQRQRAVYEREQVRLAQDKAWDDFRHREERRLEPLMETALSQLKMAGVADRLNEVLQYPCDRARINALTGQGSTFGYLIDCGLTYYRTSGFTSGGFSVDVDSAPLRIDGKPMAISTDVRVEPFNRANLAQTMNRDFATRSDPLARAIQTLGLGNELIRDARCGVVSTYQLGSIELERDGYSSSIVGSAKDAAIGCFRNGHFALIRAI